MTPSHTNKNGWRIIIGVLIFILILSGCTSTLPTVPPTNDTTHHSGLIGYYQGPLNHLSSVRRGTCPMHPSCSEYARQAMTKHGPIIGWMMATDRLMRCGRDETRLAPKVWVNGYLKYYDPLEHNDYWWGDNQKNQAP